MGTANLYRFHDGEEKNKKVCDVVIRTKHEWHILRNANMLVLSEICYFFSGQVNTGTSFDLVSDHGDDVRERSWPCWWNRTLLHPIKTFLFLEARCWRLILRKTHSDGHVVLEINVVSMGCCLKRLESFGEMGKQSWENIPMDVCFDWTDLCSLSKITLTNNPKTKKPWVC